MDVPVLIVGGGPTGLTLGALLARAGIEFLLVEKNPGTCTHPQAHAISGRTMEIFRSLDIHEEVYRRGLDMLRFGGLRIVTSLAGSELARIAPRLDPEQIAAMMSFSPCPGTSTPQDLIEPLLAGILAGGPGQLRFNTELVEFRQDADGVAATLASEGRRQSVRARWMVACDGASSGIREELGIATEGPPPLGQIIGIYFHADLMRWTRDRPAMLYWTIDSELPATFIALDGRERWSLHVSWDPETESLADYTQERCIDIARHCIGADVEIDLRSVRPWTMSARIAATFRSGRVLLAGDAAHRFPPTGGSGLNAGVGDANNLAWKLAHVVRGLAGPALLDTFESERKPLAYALADVAIRNATGEGSVGLHPPAPFNVIGPGRGLQGQRLAAGEVTVEALSAEIAAAMEPQLQVPDAVMHLDSTFAYDTGALVPDGRDARTGGDAGNSGGNGVRAGARAPHVELIRPHASTGKAGPISSLDLYRDRFTLVTPAEHADAWREAAGSVPVPIDVYGIGSDLLDPQDRFPESCGIDDGAVLVRPDGHIAWRSRRAVADTATALGDVLAQVLATG